MPNPASNEYLEKKVSLLAQIARDQQQQADLSRRELVIATKELEQKRRFDTFVDVLYSGTCVICSENLINCLDSRQVNLISYECRCTKRNFVHSTCWVRSFRCQCGEVQELSRDDDVLKSMSLAMKCMTDFAADIEIVDQNMTTLRGFSNDLVESLQEDVDLESVKSKVDTIKRASDCIDVRMRSMAILAGESIRHIREASQTRVQFVSL